MKPLDRPLTPFLAPYGPDTWCTGAREQPVWPSPGDAGGCTRDCPPQVLSLRGSRFVDLARRWPRVTSVTLSTQIHKGSSYATQEPAPNYRHTGNPNLSCRSTPRSRVPTLLRLDRRRGPVDLYSGRSRSRPRRPCSHLHADGDQQRPGRRHRRNDHRRPAGRCNLRVGNVHRRQVRRVLGRRDVLRGRSRHRRDGSPPPPPPSSSFPPLRA